MAQVDKNAAVIAYLRQCPALANSPLYFNYGQEEDASKQIITEGNDKAINKPFINGSVMKQYTFTLIDFRSITNAMLPATYIAVSENVEELFDVHAIIDWISEQDDVRNYPNFGDKCVIERIYCSTDQPMLTGINASVAPALARYTINIQIEYLDNTKKLY